MLPARTMIALLGLTGIAGGLGWVLIGQNETQTAVPQSMNVAEAAAINNPDRQASVIRFPLKETFAVVVERPLFAEGRRPPQPEPAPQPEPIQSSPVEIAAPPPMEEVKPPPPPLQAVLTGIVRSPEGDMVLLNLGDEEELVVLTPGETVEGWFLSDVGADQIALTNGDQEMTLHVVYRQDDQSDGEQTETPEVEFFGEQ